MRRINIIFILLALMAAAGCHPDHKPDNLFLECNDIGLYSKGSMRMKYDPKTGQLGFSKDKCQFRLHNDTMSEYLIVTCSKLPTTVGHEITASLKQATDKVIAYRNNLSFTVEKMADDGRVWLWCGKKNFGVIVKELK